MRPGSTCTSGSAGGISTSSSIPFLAATAVITLRTMSTMLPIGVRS